MPDSKPLISVVMPCLNAAKTLAEAIDSILDQSLNDFEFLIYDDGSTDATSTLLAEYATCDNRIRTMGNEHVGLLEALNRGCNQAQGRYIARIDADDIALPDRFLHQVTLLDANPDIGLCGTQFETIGAGYSEGRERYEAWLNALLQPKDIARELFVECPIPHPTFMMRRETFHTVGGYQDHGWPEDYDLLMRFHLNGNKMAKVSEVGLQWRHTPDRTSLTDPRYSHKQFRALKRHYLPSLFPKIEAGFYQWGAGDVGKQWLREWDSLRPTAVVDIHPRKLGRTIHGALVIPPEDLPESGQSFILVAVGAPGAREEIREWLTSRGHRELDDFLFLA